MEVGQGTLLGEVAENSSEYPADLDHPTPDVEEVNQFEMRVAGGDEVTVTIPEESLPWFISSCLRNNFDSLKRSWGMQTQRDKLREKRAAEQEAARLAAKAEREARRAERKAAKEAKAAEFQRRKEERAAERARVLEERRKQKEEEDAQRAEEREARKKERAKEKRKRARRLQKEAERRRKRGEDVPDPDPAELEESDEEDDDPPDDEEGAPIDSEGGEDEEEEEDVADDGNEEDGEEEEEEEPEMEGDEDPSRSASLSIAPSQTGDDMMDGEEEGDEDAAAVAAVGINPNFLLVLQRDLLPVSEGTPEVRFVMRSLAEVEEERVLHNSAKKTPGSEEDGEGPDADSAGGPDAADEEEEEHEEETEEEPEEEEDLVIDLLTVAVSQRSVESATLLLLKGASTKYTEEYLETVTGSLDCPALATILSAATQLHTEYDADLKINYSWVFRTTARLLSKPVQEDLIDRLLRSCVTPICALDGDAVERSVDALLFCKLLMKLDRSAMGMKKLKKIPQGDDDEEEEEEEEEEKDVEPELGDDEDPTEPLLRQPPKPRGPPFEVPPFLIGYLDGRGDDFTLEAKDHGDTVFSVFHVNNPKMALPVYWSDIALLLVALKGENELFRQLLTRKADIPREFGRPPGTWELLYKNLSVLSYSMVEDTIKANPRVFDYAGGVELAAFVREQWHELNDDIIQLFVRHFSKVIRKSRRALEGLPKGKSIVAQANQVEAAYDEAAALMKDGAMGQEGTERLKALAVTHHLNLFTPFYLYMAVCSNNLAAVELFLDEGCEGSVQVDEYHRPQGLLRHAIEGERQALVLLLIQRGAELTEVWDGGRTSAIRYMEKTYSRERYVEVMEAWKESEFQRSSGPYRYGLLRKSPPAFHNVE